MAAPNTQPPFFQRLMQKVIASEILQLSVMACVMAFILFILYTLASFLSTDQEGADFMISQGLRIVIVILVAWIVMRLFRLVGVQLVHKKTKKHVPRYVITFFNWSVIALSILFITVSIFNQPPWALVTAGGLMGAGLAFSIQGIVMDMISGLILDVERSYKIGDWIKLDADNIGQVVKTTWRHVEVMTEHKTLLIIPNGKIISDAYENLSQSGEVYADHISVSLDHNVPVERAERVFMDALLSIKAVVDSGIYGVYADGVNEGGISYTLRYGVKGYDAFREMKHKVLEAATEKLHASGMAISETIGEYTLSKAVSFYEADELPVEDVLKKVALFKALKATELKALAKKAQRYLVDVGHDLIIDGDQTNSLFIIAEGVVDVVISIPHQDTTKEQVVASLGEGNFVGDRALLLGEKRSATVRARTKVLAYEVTKEAFQPLLKARPDLINDLSEIVVQRELDTAQKRQAALSPQKAKSLKEDLIKGMKKFFGI